MDKIVRIAIVWAVVCMWLGSGVPVAAQADDLIWSEPANLSHSGAAEAPVLVTGSGGQIQAFWWDRFTRITTSYTRDGLWSAPTTAPIVLPVEQDAGSSSKVITPTLATMPHIVGADDMAFALWLGAPDLETTTQPLLYSKLTLGTNEWTEPASIAESAVAWEMMGDPQGNLHLVYRQTKHTETSPAGIYYRRSSDGGDTWSEPAVLYPSLYVRLWPAETSSLTIVADGQGNVLVSWDDPRQGHASYVWSADRGVSWSTPREVGDGDRMGQHPHFVTISSLAGNGGQPGILLLWEQVGVSSTCALMQQLSVDGGQTWSPASRILDDLTTCPSQIAMTQTSIDSGSTRVLAMMGMGAESLLLAAWDGTQWSKIKSLTFSFEDSETTMTTYLDALQIVVTSGNTVTVAGQGQNDDVWALTGQTDAVEWAFAPPSPWSDVEISSESEMSYGFPAAATDAEGNLHVMWAATLAADRPDTALFYSRWDRTSWSRPVAVLDLTGGIAQSPLLVYSGGFLHAAWSSGPTGTVYYSRVHPQDAYVAGSWSTPQMLGVMDVGSAPAMTVDLLGRLHVVYAVPVNEGRGIYYTRSDDHGESWREVVQVFDAVAAHWSSIVHPDVTVDAQGIIHAVWLRAPLPGDGLPQGVYYAQSTDLGKTWSEAILIAEGAYDWPQMATTLYGQIAISWQDMIQSTVQYRTSNDGGMIWDSVSQIPNLQAVEGRTILAEDIAGRVHLMALAMKADGDVMFLHLIYEEGRWSESDSIRLGDDYTSVSGAAPSFAEELGLLDVVGVGSQLRMTVPVSVLWHTYRSVEIEAARQASFAPEATPTPGPTPTFTPTPRPTVNPDPPQPSVPVVALGPVSLPILALGGVGIALLLVAGAFAWKTARR